mmetsp:Transcript_5777/g.8395  ORF Transcript_5777/g.8395 Transcript_5777/m.8395 type:complete len:87 (+) Transcript_5777:511-771(+)
MYENVTCSTKLVASPWQDHWHQCLFVFGDNHKDCSRLNEGGKFQLYASHDETSVSFSIETSSAGVVDQHLNKKLKVENTIHKAYLS